MKLFIFYEMILCRYRQLGLAGSAPNSVDLTPTFHKDRCQGLDFLNEHQKAICAGSNKLLPVSNFCFDEKKYDFCYLCFIGVGEWG